MLSMKNVTLNKMLAIEKKTFNASRLIEYGARGVTPIRLRKSIISKIAITITLSD